jgi:hypothetical protein
VSPPPQPPTAAPSDRQRRVPLRRCATGHGEGGKGNGAAARSLTTRRSDLATRVGRSDGAFPFLRVGQIIDGREDIAQHGGREMTLWGYMFGVEAGDQFGRMREVYVQGRVYELVLYLNSIQQ